jgi:hypothetical protein
MVMISPDDLVDNESWVDSLHWGEGADEMLTCGLESPEPCESCQ